jgi:hypothetical protein
MTADYTRKECAMRTKKVDFKRAIEKPATENQEQRALVKWLSLHPILKDFYCKNHNEGARTPAQGFNLKLLGLRPGVSDLFIYYPTAAHPGLWIEMKRNKIYTRSERMTETWLAQEKFQDCVKSVGFAAYFCYGVHDAIAIIEKYLHNTPCK